MCFHCSATNGKPQSCSHLLWFPYPAWLNWACPCQWQFYPPYFQDVGLATSSPCSQSCGLEHPSLLLIGPHFATLVCRWVGRYSLWDPCPKNLDQEPTSRTMTCVVLVAPESWTNHWQPQWPSGCSMMLPSSLFQPSSSLYHLWSKGCTSKGQHDISGYTRSSHLDSFPQVSHQLEWSLLLCRRWRWDTHSWGHFQRSSNLHIASWVSGSQLKDCRSSSLGAELNQTQSLPKVQQVVSTSLPNHICLSVYHLSWKDCNDSPTSNFEKISGFSPKPPSYIHWGTKVFLQPI